MVEDWFNILQFALVMIQNAKKAYAPDPVDERIAIVSLDHATELLMKSFLLEKGYIIDEIDINKIKKRINKNTQLKDLLNKDRTISFKDAFAIVEKLIKLDKTNKKKIERFHRLRNKIQHKGMYISSNETEPIKNFVPSLEILYKKMFPKYADAFPKLIFSKN
jgi:argininosuccinate lyase